MLTAPEPAYHGVVYTDHYGEAAYVARCRTVCQRNTGAVLSPLSAFLLLQGLETLPLRMERHAYNGERVAQFLRSHRRVAWVNYAGFSDNPYHNLGLKYLGGRWSSPTACPPPRFTDATAAGARRATARWAYAGNDSAQCRY